MRPRIDDEQIHGVHSSATSGRRSVSVGWELRVASGEWLFFGLGVAVPSSTRPYGHLISLEREVEDRQSCLSGTTGHHCPGTP